MSAAHTRPNPDRVSAALEASCGALIALEFARALLGEGDDELSGVQALTSRAIEAFRSAITELRSLARAGSGAQGDRAPARGRASMLALGFVLATGSGPPGRPRDGGDSERRRVA